ncbi:hypothetical protein EGW08_000945 [Elysia chlorotica]|uniref:Uncharacterized protein n=1 Tax=Elysia chlorotica TaxID=188477 RepID=A0A3S1A5P5_ELYCH|nr:hypothetical protein EGW08_000945 [Elysia chlorotica]
MGFTSSGKHPPSSASTQNWLWVFRVGAGFLLLASLLFLLGFFTKMWYDDNSVHYGLWRVCTGAVCEDIDSDDLPSYRIATQALQCLAFSAYGIAPILHYIFYCTKREKGFDLRIRVFDITYGIGVIFHMASVLIFGLEHSEPQHFSWSYEMTAASAAINTIGICVIAFSRKRALHDFRFCSHKGKAKRSGRVGAAGGAGFSRGSRRGVSSRQQQYPQNQQSPYSSNSQLVFGPRQKHQIQDPQVSQPNVSITVHNTIYTGGPEKPQHQHHQQQQQQYPPFAFSTQASASAFPPPQPQQGVLPYPHQAQTQGFPYPSPSMQAYPPQGEPPTPSAPTYPSHNPVLAPSGVPKDIELPPLRGGNSNSYKESDSVDSGRPPSYEELIIKTPENTTYQ